MPETILTISASSLEFAEKMAKEMGLPSAGAYLERLIEKARRRDERRSRVEALLIHGLDSGPTVPVTREDLDQIRRKAHEILQSRATAR